MKSHKFAAMHFVVMFHLIAACSANNPATTATSQKVINEKTARTFDCRTANDYRFVEVANPSRKHESDPGDPTDLHVVVGDDVISKIELPREPEVKNFALNSVEKDKAGFEIKVDWGSGLDHYEIQFNFKCKESSFFLYRVTKVSFSTTNPDSGSFLDKKKTKVIRIEPNLPIERFVMTNYL